MISIWHFDNLFQRMQEIFDGHIESAKKISKPILKSVRDFDGDGTFEILVNVFNYNDENN